ncbi:MAG: hypothetical protein DHS20C17_20040 [Cyclobacteriaceae bacterium]|nr:MAG: hypothetical protein DHS20C17_20040 [Cyclobacteriaceae bacterium]
MYRLFFLWLPLITQSSGLIAQSPEVNPAAYGIGPFVAADQSKYALWRNVAGIASTSGWNILVSYQFPYGLSELQNFSFGITFPWKPRTGISLFQFGNGPLTNQQLALNAAVNLDRINFGIRIKYWQLAFSGITSLKAVSAAAGFQGKLSDQIEAGVFVDNILQTRIGSQEILPLLWYSGIKFQPASHLSLHLETGYVLGQQWRFKMGIEYRIKNRFFFRTGFEVPNLQSYFGLGFLADSVELDYALSTHPDLGITHQAAGSYSWP